MRIVHPPGGNCYRRESDPMIARSIVLIVAIIICTTAGATVVDLTGSNEGGTINDAQFVFTTPQPTGTVVIQPFLRVENTSIEQGSNTSGGPPFDDNAGPCTTAP